MHANEFAAVRTHPVHHQHSLYSLRAYQPGDVITAFSAGSVHSEPTYLTVQLDDTRHITLLPDYLQFINHHCDPNIFFDTTRMEVICLKPIREGDELTFFYPSTEWEMAQGFDCNCGSPNCLGRIQGASNLPKEVLLRYKLTDFIQNKLKSVG